MTSRDNLEALAVLGKRREKLRRELDNIESQIDLQLRITYPEGWTWPQLMEASSFSLGTLRLHLKKLGLTTGGDTRRGNETPIAQDKRAAQRQSRSHSA